MELDTSLDFRIASLWNGGPARGDEIVLVRVRALEGFLLIQVEAPFHKNPAPPLPKGPCWGLWDYEVVELFVVGSLDAYTEIELGPHGHHLVLKFQKRREAFESELPIDYSSEIQGDCWKGEARIPWSYLPEDPGGANAYAIHGEGEQRRFLSVFPVLGPDPDFHRIEQFPAGSFPLRPPERLPVDSE